MKNRERFLARSRHSSVRMSLQLAIPWQVGLHQSLLLLHQPRAILVQNM